MTIRNKGKEHQNLILHLAFDIKDCYSIFCWVVEQRMLTMPCTARESRNVESRKFSESLWHNLR